MTGSPLARNCSSTTAALATAASSVPSYTDQQASDLASVVADPVRADGASTTLFGASAIPLLAMLALRSLVPSGYMPQGGGALSLSVTICSGLGDDRADISIDRDG